MTKIRIPLIISIAILVAGLIVGSFFDLQIAQAIFDNRNGFGIFISAFSFVPGYAFLCLCSGALFVNARKSKKPISFKFILYFIGVAAVLVAIYFTGVEIFSINGYNQAGIGYKILGFGIATIFDISFTILGCYLFKDNKNERIWIPIFILLGVVLIALAPVTQVAKILTNRPRYRLIQSGLYPELKFYNWFEACSEYKQFVASGALREDFKSFPSGHAGTSVLNIMTLAIMLPLAKPHLEKYTSILYIVGFAFVLVVMYVRMCVGAHFLSDVCMGALIVFVLLFIANEIIVRKKLFKLE